MLKLPYNPSAKPEQCRPICRSSNHTLAVGWANTPLMSLYRHVLKENVQLAVVMSNIKFTSLQTMQAMAQKAGQTFEGIQNGQPTHIPPASSSAPNTNPNAMDLPAFQHGGPHNQLSNAERNCWLQLKLCFRYGIRKVTSNLCLQLGSLNFKPKSTGSMPTPAPPTRLNP
ncbi:uncharacterized protein VP01_9884g1 [Puccinia sorghi]|uniref:Uncharacterized protein n=1 Tax=Puccinia sorghi TaxID=27349 RepID=A0A0L6U5H3_9BASI|nr:uncharacterized protein VP01_9884g1 [Puccinia sorghi]